MAKLAAAIVELESEIPEEINWVLRVDGHTDNVPLSGTGRLRDNWELSSARAASIVRMLAMDGVDPSRLAAVGYGEFQPVADNATAEGRGRNRRVVLVISRNLDTRRGAGSTATQQAETGTQPAPASASGVPQS
jgi:chemotaxis protein MotB